MPTCKSNGSFVYPLQLLSGQAVVGGDACLSGSGESSLPAEGSTADEEVVILRSKLQQSEAVCRDLRRELSHVKNDCLQLHGTKVRSRLRHTTPRYYEARSLFCACILYRLRIAFVRPGLLLAITHKHFVCCCLRLQSYSVNVKSLL